MNIESDIKVDIKACCRLSVYPKMTLGVSAAVSSCSDPFMAAIC
jgi:hypothetical protein